MQLLVPPDELSLCCQFIDESQRFLGDTYGVLASHSKRWAEPRDLLASRLSTILDERRASVLPVTRRGIRSHEYSIKAVCSNPNQ